MLVGTIGEAFSPRTDFAETCGQRMDAGSPFAFDLAADIPGLREAGLIALVLCSAAWLIVVIGTRWSVKTKVLGVMVSVPGLASAAATATGLRLDKFGDAGTTLLWLLPPIALIAVLAVNGWPADVLGPSFPRVLVLLWGATAFDFPHQLVDYAAMTGWSSANWDSPPGTGALTVVTLATSAVLTLVMTMRAPRRLVEHQAAAVGARSTAPTEQQDRCLDSDR